MTKGKRHELSRKRIERALETAELYRQYKVFSKWLDSSAIKLHGFRYSKKDYCYIPTQEHYIEIREKGSASISVYRDKVTKEKISLTRGTRLHKREIDTSRHDVEALACICFYVANVQDPVKYRTTLFGSINTEATTRSIGAAIIQVKSDLNHISPGFLSSLKTSKERALILLRFCLQTETNRELHLGLPKGTVMHSK